MSLIILYLFVAEMIFSCLKLPTDEKQDKKSPETGLFLLGHGEINHFFYRLNRATYCSSA